MKILGTDLSPVGEKHVPLSADDGQITRAITLKGCTVSNLYRQRLRYEGRLTNCETGDRILTVTNMEAHLPRTMIIGKYRAVVVYRGQPDDRKECTKCLQKGHNSTECQNEVVCRQCQQTGHISSECPLPLQNEDEEQESDAEDDETGAETDTDAAQAADTDMREADTENQRETENQPHAEAQPTQANKSCNATKAKSSNATKGSGPHTAPIPSPQKTTTSEINKTQTFGIPQSGQGTIFDFFSGKTPQRKSSNIPAVIRSPPTPTEQIHGQSSHGRKTKEHKAKRSK